MASPFTLPPPAPLDIHDTNAADKWKKFTGAWTNYLLVMEQNKISKSIQLQVSTLIKVIGEDAHEVFLHLVTGTVMVIILRYSQS